MLKPTQMCHWVLKRKVSCGLGLAVAFATPLIFACQVPVFRYAIERWMPDKYEVVILHEGPLSASDASSIQRLSGASRGTVNALIRTQDVRQNPNTNASQIWGKHGKQGQSIMAVLYPPGVQGIADRLISVADCNEATFSRLCDSPVRSEMVKRLIDGHSAVWVFVPSGHASKDGPARTALDEQLKKSQQELVLPELDPAEIQRLESSQDEIRLRIEFSVVTVDPKDPQEQFLMQILLKSEPDLQDVHEPIAFPVFGRGRVLYALVGKGINPEMISEACRFMIGPCSCQVKQQNPGFDLLTQVDWEKKLGGAKLSDPLPEETAEPKLLTIPSGSKSK